VSLTTPTQENRKKSNAKINKKTNLLTILTIKNHESDRPKKKKRRGGTSGLPAEYSV